MVCLLAELQQKDSAFLNLEGELQRCKQEFELFRSQREKEESNMTFDEGGQQKLVGREESSLEGFGLHSEEKQGTVTGDHDRLTPVSGVEVSWCDDHRTRTGKVNKMQRSHDREKAEFSPVRATADLAAELPALQQDRQLLQKESSDLNNSVDDSQGMPTENKRQEEKHPEGELQKHSPISAALPCSTGPRSPSRPRDIIAKDDLQIEGSCDQEQGDLERVDEGIEGALKAACEPEINRLQEQVCNLFPLVQFPTA